MPETKHGIDIKDRKGKMIDGVFVKEGDQCLMELAVDPTYWPND